MVRAGNGTTGRTSAGPGDGIQRRSQRRDSRQGLPALRTPVRAFHTPNLVVTSDSNDGTGGAALVTAVSGATSHRPQEL